jgi:hypothetical protein
MQPRPDRSEIARYPRRCQGVRGLCLVPIAIALSLLMVASAGAAPIVTFVWDPASDVVSPGATELFVDLWAEQSDGADAAGITLGFSGSGIVTGVELVGFGAAVSAADSFFGDLGGVTGLIASAPASPGSFGEDVDFLVATLRVLVDTALGANGALGLEDLSELAGFPALAADGRTEIPSDLSAAFTVAVVPEPTTLALLASAWRALGAARRRRLPAS